MTKIDLKGAEVIPTGPGDCYDEPSRALTEYCDDVNVKNKIIWMNRIIFKRLNINIFKKEEK